MERFTLLSRSSSNCGQQSEELVPEWALNWKDTNFFIASNLLQLGPIPLEGKDWATNDFSGTEPACSRMEELSRSVILGKILDRF